MDDLRDCPALAAGLMSFADYLGEVRDDRFPIGGTSAAESGVQSVLLYQAMYSTMARLASPQVAVGRPRCR